MEALLLLLWFLAALIASLVVTQRELRRARDETEAYYRDRLDPRADTPPPHAAHAG